MNIFEFASRNKLRFTSSRGDLTVEQLFDLPLVARSGDFDLKHVYAEVGKERDALEGTGDDFLGTSSAENKALGFVEAKIELLKHIRDLKIAEKTAAAEASDRAAERQRLKNALAAREEQDLSNLTVAQITERLAQL